MRKVQGRLVAIVIAAAVFCVLLSPNVGAASQVTIVYRTWEGGQFMKQNQEVVDKFNKLHPNIKVVLSTVADNYDQKLQVELASKTAPDVFQLSAEYIASYGKLGALLDLAPYFAHSKDLKLTDFYEPLQRQYTVAGKAYGMSNAVEIVLIAYNKAVFDKAGIPYPSADPRHPWTWDEFLKIAQKLTLDDKGRNAADPHFDPGHIVQWGFNGTSGWVFYYMPFVWSNGGDLFNATATKLALDEPASVEALQQVADLVNKYHVAPRSNDLDRLGMSTSDMFVQGKLAMKITGTWDVEGLSVEHNFHNWDVTFLPVMKTGKLYTTIPQSGYSIAANCKHPEEAFEFLKFLLSEEGQMYRASVGNVIPSLNRMLTPEGRKAWIRPNVHPPHFVEVALGYMKYGKLLSPTDYFPAWWTKVSDALDSGLAPLWSGKASAKAVVAKITPQIDSIIAKGE